MKEATESLWLLIKMGQKSAYQLFANRPLVTLPTGACMGLSTHPPT